MLDLGALKITVKVDKNNASNELKEFNNDVEDKSGKIKNKLISLGTAMKGAAVAAVGLAAKQFVDITKDALEAYAQYEQLTGGIETLYKESADTMMDYAANAYKTAGMSANQYMELSTSFAASLISSLGGDTQKAANYANMAITDMSDNANKMGTDMERITDAYQGFSKQNYTMLDNLKLGYGGTKAEMERLLEDAEKIKAKNGEVVDYSINSYSDIVNAIHTVQTEMGITGTTAEEAATTIEGATNQTKAAWQNLLVGFGDENADLKALSSEYAESLVNEWKLKFERLAQIIPAFLSTRGGVVAEYAPQLFDKAGELIPQAFSKIGELILTYFPQLMANLPSLLFQLAGFIVSQLPAIIKFIFTAIVALIKGAWALIANLFPAAAQFILNAIKVIIDTIKPIFETLAPIVKTVFNAIKPVVETVFNAIVSAAKTVYNFFVNTLIPIVKKIGEVFGKVFNAIKSVVEKVFGFIKSGVDKVASAFKKIVDVIKKVADKFGEFKQNVVDKVTGVVSGVKEKINSIKNFLANFSLVNAGKKMFQSLWNGIKGVWNSIKSWVHEKVEWLKSKLTFGVSSKGNKVTVKGHRNGLREVPYDGYAAQLHKGEMVLTQPEADKYRRNGETLGARVTNTVNFNGNYSFRDEADIDYFMKEAGKLIKRKVS